MASCDVGLGLGTSAFAKLSRHFRGFRDSEFGFGNSNIVTTLETQAVKCMYSLMLQTC